MRLAHRDRQSMELVEELGVAFDRVGSESLLREMHQRFVASAISTRGGLYQPVALGDPSKILVRHWNSVPQGIEQNGVRGLGTDTGESHQPMAQSECRRCSQHVQRSGKLFVQHGDKRFEGWGF